MTRPAPLAAVLGCLLLAASAHAPAQTGRPMPNDRATLPDAAQRGGDAEALATLMAVNEHEIASAKLALKKKPSEPVAQYAKMLEREHGDNQRKTREVAKSADVDPNETPAVEALKTKSEREREALAAQNGEAFERAFIDAMVKGHAEALAKIDDELLPAATNPAVAEHLRMTRTHIAQHLEQARQLDAKSTAQR